MSTSMLSQVCRLSVLIVVLATGTQASGQASRTAELQQLTNDFGFQINMLRDFDRREAEERTRALAVVLDRWNSSTRTDADYEKMKQWLKASIHTTMPGSHDPLPQLPWFEQRLAAAPELPLPNEPRTSESETEPLPEPAPTIAQRVDPTPPAVAAEPPKAKSIWERHPAARPVDIVNPFEDDEPVATIAPSTPTTRVAMRPTGFSSTVEKPAIVGINTAELGARVRGYEHGLKGVEARMVASPNMSMDELLSVVRELRQLSSQREFVSMYLDMVALDHPEQAPELPTVANAKSMARQRLERLRRSDAGHAEAIDTLEQMLMGL